MLTWFIHRDEAWNSLLEWMEPTLSVRRKTTLHVVRSRSGDLKEISKFRRRNREVVDIYAQIFKLIHLIFVPYYFDDTVLALA